MRHDLPPPFRSKGYRKFFTHSVHTVSAHISPAQAARRASVSRWTIIRALKAQLIEGFRDNRGHWKINPDSVDVWVSAHHAHAAHTEHDTDEHPLAQPSDSSGEAEALRTEVRLLREQMGKDSETAHRQLEDMRDRAMKAEAREEESRESLKLLIEQLSRAERRRRWWPF